MSGKRIMAFVLVVLLCITGINYYPAYAVDVENKAQELSDLNELTVNELPNQINDLKANVLESQTSSLKAITVAKRTPQEIMEYIRMHPDNFDGKTIYKREPVLTAPYDPGKLVPEAITSVVNSVNQMRFIAGLAGEVTENPSYSTSIQAGALINAVNDELEHYPTQPAGMSDELYKLGYSGTSSSNIAMGYNLKGSIHGYMDDSDSSNIDKVGHRRWIIYPQLDKVGFGQVERYSGLYVVGSNNNTYNEIGVAWPAQTMPIEYYARNMAWSISFGSNVSSSTQVTLKRNKTGQVWDFTELSTTTGSSGKEFYINNENYGQKGCLIFKPDGLYDITSGEVFDVTIKNLGITGLENEFTYQVKFFSLRDRYLSATAEKTNIYIKGKEIQLNLQDNASWDNPTYTYSSSDSSIAEVTENGLVIGKGVGTATITVYANETESHNAGSYEVTFNVSELPKQEVAFASTADVEKTYGDKDFENIATNNTVGGGEITYSSSDEKVAIVDAKTGQVSIKGAGSAVITATAAEVFDICGETSVSYNVKVSSKSISIENIEVPMKKYDSNNTVTKVIIKFVEVVEGDILEENVDYTVEGSYEDENAGENKVVNLKVEMTNKNYVLDKNEFTVTSSITTSAIYAISLTNLKQEEGSVTKVGWTIEPKDKTAKVEVEYGVTSGSTIIWNNELPTEIGEYQVRARLVESSNLIPSGKEADVEGTLVIKEKYVPPFNPGGGGGAGGGTGGGTGGGSGSGGGQSPGSGDDKRPENPAEPIVEVGTDEEGNVIADVTVPEDEPITTVEVPVDLGEEPGTVIIEITTEDGTTEKIIALYKDGKVIVKLEENAKVKIISEVAPLNDLPTFVDTNNHWAKDYIDKAVQLGIFKGKSETNFGAEDNMTREQMWMVISRLKGEGQATMEDARNWAMANEVSDGSNPKGDVTREQLVTLIWRALGESKSTYDISQYSDYQNISSWAKEAFAWAVEIGLVNGTSATTLSPHGTATRAQLATILARLVY